MATKRTNEKVQNGTTQSTTKQMKSGTVNLGQEYEKEVPAYLSLQMIQDKSIKFFEFTLNSSSFQKFDDLILSITYHTGDIEHFAIQLKHRESGRDVLKAGDEFSRTDSKGKAKDFNISGFKSAFNKQQQEIQKKYNFILYTNAKFTNVDNISYYKINTLDAPFQASTFTKGKAYQFEETDSNVNCFYKKFYLLSEQKNVDEMRMSIENIFVQNFSSTTEKATLYRSFFEPLHNGKFDDTTLTRDDVILKLGDLLTSTIKILPSFTTCCDKRISLVEEAITKFDLTFLPDVDPNFIKTKWKYRHVKEEKEEEEEIYKFARKHKLLLKNQAIKEEDETSIFCVLYEKPLFLHLTKESEKVVAFFTSLLKTLQSMTIRLVLVGGTLNENSCDSCKIFHNLKELEIEHELFKKISNTFKVRIQGRDWCTISEVKDKYSLNLSPFVTPTELFNLLENDLSIGDVSYDLPTPYISRILIKEKFSHSFLKQICALKTTIVFCNGNAKKFKQFLEENDFDVNIVDFRSYNKSKSNVLILTDESNTDKIIEDFNQLKLLKDYFLEWKDNKVDPQKSSILNNQLNVIYGDPGIGKTTMMQFLALNCPSSHWIVYAPLQQICSVTKSDESLETTLEKILQFNKKTKLDERVCNYLVSKKKIVLFFDGLNELNNSTIDKAVNIFKKLEELGYTIWISCTCSLKEKLENSLNIYSFYLFEEVTTQDQINYFRERLKGKFKDEEINQIIQNILSDSKKSNSDILKLPLLLYILSENISNEKQENNLKEHLNLSTIYSSFIYGKVQHNISKIDQDKNQTKLIIDGFIAFYMINYKIAALQACLEPNIFKLLNLQIDETFLKQIKENNDILCFTKLNQDDSFTFTHHTIAEYFAALWLSENFLKIPKDQRSFIFQAKYDGIRRFLDAQLAEDCPLHLAVLQQDVKNVTLLLKENLHKCDKGGRNALHLAVSSGKRNPILITMPAENMQPHCADKINENQRKILKILLSEPELSPFDKDKIFEWDTFQYADASLSLFSLEELATKHELNFEDLRSCDEHLLTLFYYCIRKGYLNLLKIAIQAKGLSCLEKYPLFHVALEYDQAEVANLLIENKVNIFAVDSQKQTALHKAAIWGNVDMTERLLAKGLNIEEKDSTGKTPLQFAAKMGHQKIVEILVDHGGDVNTTDDCGRTPLHKAAYVGNIKVVRCLVKKGADINLHNKNLMLRTALQRAAEMGYCEIVQFLVEQGADVDALDKNKKTALHYAAYEGHENVVNYLIISGKVDIFAKDDDEKTAKQIAKCRGHASICQMLQKAEEKSAKRWINKIPKGTTLHEAAANGDLKKLKKLLASGDNKELDENRNTVLHLSAYEGFSKVVKFLLSSNAKTSVKNSDGRTPLHLAAQRGHLDIVKLLLNPEENSAKDKWGLTPLHRAAYKGHLEVVKLLVENGVDPNCESFEGGTPLHSGARGGHNDVIKYLVSKDGKLEVKRKNNGASCLHVAVQRECTETVEFLLEIKKDIIFEKDHKGKTALHWAAEKGYKNIVQILVEAGSDTEEQDSQRKTALDIAKTAGRREVVDYLLSKVGSS